LSFLFLTIMSGLFAKTSLSVWIPWFHEMVIILLLLLLLSKYAQITVVSYFQYASATAHMYQA
jgi:hypothetical protein